MKKKSIIYLIVTLIFIILTTIILFKTDLYDAMKEVGIETSRTPFKTIMYIRPYYVAVEEGYGAKGVTLYDSTNEIDIENIKKKYCEDNGFIYDCISEQ